MVLLIILLSSPVAALSTPLAKTEEISPFTKIDQSLADKLDTDEQIDLLVRFDEAAEYKARSAISILDKRVSSRISGPMNPGQSMCLTIRPLPAIWLLMNMFHLLMQ
jgi:hypothetical protein